MKHKNLVVGGLLTATLLGGSAFALSASAATNNNADTLASKIATKFNLNKDEVQQVIDENHEERHAERRAEMQTRLEERLTQAVTDGKLSEEQKTKVLDYVKSQEAFFEGLKDKTQEERRDALEAHREEVKKWAEENGIDEEYLMIGGFRGGHHGGHMMRGGHEE